MPLVIALEDIPAPLDALRALHHLPRPALLHGASGGHELARYSFLSADPIDTIDASADDWPAVCTRVRRTMRSTASPDPMLPPFAGGWIGWLGYELGRAFDSMQCATADPMPVPDVALALHDWVIAWDHAAARAWLISTGIDPHGDVDAERAGNRARDVLALLAKPAAASAPTSARIGDMPGVQRDFSPSAYRNAVARVIDHVVRGDIFQANLSQRFIAPRPADPLRLMSALMRRTPAPMAAYLAHGDVHVLSASPERFLRFDPRTRVVETRPIKGTRPRGRTAEEDEALAGALVTSAKDRAENVMIVDLLRNDLARVADRGSVDVPALCRLERHPTVHHLVSIVTARVRPDRDALDLIAAAFPSGSVTGAPKLRAMAVIAELEPVRRGVYCGAIGWIGLDGAMDTNVAIRTITLDASRASLHAGGGVTARSDPDEEYRETLDKAAALLAALEDAD